MKLKSRILNGAAGLCLLAFTAAARADDTGMAYMQDGNSNQMSDARGMMRSYRLNGAARASDITGWKVYNYQQEELGKVNDLLVDVEAGRLVQVIVVSGGVLGMGGTLLAVPPGILHPETTNRTIQLDVSKEKFTAGPQFTSTNRDEMAQSNAVCEAYDYYRQRPFFVSARYGTNVIAETMGGPLPLNMDGTPNVTGGRLMDVVNNEKIAAENGQDTNNMANGSAADGLPADHNHMRRAHLGYLERFSKLTGLPVKNMQDERVGTVKDLAVDLTAGRIVAVIVSTGGFMGMGNELSAVPPGALRFNGQRDTLVLDTTRETLTNAPHFKSGQWPDLGRRDYLGNMYHAYHVEPYFNTNGTADADDTGRNVRDRDGGTLTPMDQGNNQADINTTAQIRKAIVADQTLSTTAKNVKIITANGKVTLRGPVNTSEEKDAIGQIATRIVPANTVDNQLEVRTRNYNNN